MKHHFISAISAAFVAAIIALGIAFIRPPRVEHTWTYSNAFSPHAWPPLSLAEKSAFTDLARKFPKNVKFDIVCNDAGCSDLAADLDDAFEDAGLESALDKAIGPLGYGIGVQVNDFDKPAALSTIEAVAKITSGRLQPAIVAGTSPPGYVTILFGKRPR